jgi:hypothetical protein
MKRLAWLAAIPFAVACGGSDDDGGADPDASVDVDAQPQADAEPEEVNPISGVTAAFETDEDGNLVAVGEANWDCIGDADEAETTLNPITISGRVNEFLDRDLEDVEIVVFDTTDFYADPIAGPVAAIDPDDDEDGLLYEDLVLPAGVTRVAFRVTSDQSLITFSLGQTFEADAEVAEVNLSPLADVTADTLAGAALQRGRTEGLGIVAGDVFDCDGNRVMHTIGALSTTSGELNPPVDAWRTYYFGALLPVAARTETQNNGRFMIPEIQPSEDPIYVQVWGYPDQSSFDNDELVLLSELETTIVADGLLTAAMRPLTGEDDGDNGNGNGNGGDNGGDD